MNQKLNLLMQKIRKFFPKSKHFVFNVQKGAGEASLRPTCAPIYHAIKEKKKKKACGNAGLKWTGTVPVTYREKYYLKEAGLKSLEPFFSTLHKWNPLQIFFKDFGRIYSWNIYWTAIFGDGHSDRAVIKY